MKTRPALLTRSYVLVCAATIAYYLSLQMQVPLYPAFLRDRTGASPAMIGTFIGSFTALAVLTRPLVGRALATRSRRMFMAAGGAVTAAATIGYWATPGLAALMIIRLLHGTATALFYTAASVTVVEIAPAERRGEALSIFSMFLYIGLAVGPAIGLALERAFGYGAMFAASALVAAACAAISLAIREPGTPASQSPEAIELERHPLINRRALFPGAVLALASVGYAAGLNFTADFTDALRIEHGTWYFPVLAVTVIATRIFSGRISDRTGRIRVAAPGLAMFAVAMLIQANARSVGPLLVSAVLFGSGFGMFFPTMMAYTTDRVRPAERVSALATFTAAFDIGFGLGSPLLGAVRGASGYPSMYVLAGIIAAMALVLLLVGARRGPQTVSQP